MLEFYASEFVAISQSLAAAQMGLLHVESHRPATEFLKRHLRPSLQDRILRRKNVADGIDAAFSQAQTAVETSIRSGIEGACLILEQMGLAFSLKEASRLAEIERSGKKVSPEEIDGLLNRIRDELDAHIFFQLEPSQIKFYSYLDPLFGADVEAKFPTMSEDIAEAGNCIAFERSTAAVFHLMRIMEIALQKLGEKLQITLASEKNWQNILDEVNKAIRILDQKDRKTKAYAEVAAHLYNVKLCWRNEVMHPKQTYTPDEAQKLFSAVETFIRGLAGIL